MALTFSTKTMLPLDGGWRHGFVDITLDNSYSAGGWAIAASDLNLGTLYHLEVPSAGVAGSLGYPLRWDHATGKLLAFEEADGAAGLQEIDAADLNGEVLRCRYWGW
jgi:hypothetical protein